MSTEEKITFLNPEAVSTRPILAGDIGKGFNVLNATTTDFLFQSLRVQCSPGQGEQDPRLYIFKDTQEYLREMVSRAGLPTLERGMFSMCDTFNSNLPFLCSVDNMDKTQHFLEEIERISYDLKADAPGSLSKGLKEEEKRLREALPFSLQSKNVFYAFFQKYGTHYINRASFGNKAEMRWSVRTKNLEADPFSKVTKNQSYKQRFEESFTIWKQTGFDTKGESSKKLAKGAPKNCSVELKVTPGFVAPSAAALPAQIRYHLLPIHMLFEEPVRKDLEIAVRVFLEEMRPKVDAEDIREGEIVAIYCPDNGCWIRTDDHGHIFADRAELGPENKFEVRRKGSKIGFKSLKFQNKYLSKALMRSLFHFHKLQFMGPHESFEISGDYLFVGANLVENVGYLYVAEEKQLQVSEAKRSRLLIFNADVRNSSVLTPEEISEPLYVEDENIALVESLSEVPPMLKDYPKANSTSSLFIKDTIILPNVDELTRCMALHLSNLIKDGHSASKLNIPEIFSEDVYPLTKSVPKLQHMRIPSVETIFHFLNTIFKVEKLSPEPGIMALVYIERVMEKTHMHLHAASWRRVVLAALIIASKVWEDQSVWTVDFLELFPSANIKDLNRLEQNILATLEFNVSIKASDYVRHYFELRAYMKSDFTARGSKPLDHEALQRLEIRSASSEEEWKAPFRMMKAATSTALVDTKKKHGLGVLS